MDISAVFLFARSTKLNGSLGNLFSLWTKIFLDDFGITCSMTLDYISLQIPELLTLPKHIILIETAMKVDLHPTGVPEACLFVPIGQIVARCMKFLRMVPTCRSSRTSEKPRTFFCQIPQHPSVVKLVLFYLEK